MNPCALFNEKNGLGAAVYSLANKTSVLGFLLLYTQPCFVCFRDCPWGSQTDTSSLSGLIARSDRPLVYFLALFFNHCLSLLSEKLWSQANSHLPLAQVTLQNQLPP